MKKNVLVVLVLLVGLVGFSQDGFLPTNNGMIYKIVPNGGKDSIKIGNIVRYSIIQKFGDSVVRNSEESGNGFAKVDSIDQPFAETIVMKMMHVGDSALIKISSDTIYQFILKQSQSQDPNFNIEQFEANLPSFFKRKNDYVYVGFTILQQYTQDSLARIDFEKEKPKMEAYQQKMQQKAMEEQAARDAVGFVESDKIFKEYLGAKLNTLKKTPSGALVETIKVGTGVQCVKGATAKVRYKCMSLDGKIIYDGNFPVNGEAAKPTYDVVIGGGGSITGFLEAIATMRKGGKAFAYLPTKVAYGGQGQGTIKPYENIKFELEVIDVILPKAAVKKPTTQAKKVPAKKAPVKKAPSKHK
jgi:FKBP-type peptidyl-prolyl cis-trans isomerase